MAGIKTARQAQIPGNQRCLEESFHLFGATNNSCFYTTSGFQWLRREARAAAFRAR
jgi:hypothetical protein